MISWTWLWWCPYTTFSSQLNAKTEWSLQSLLSASGKKKRKLLWTKLNLLTVWLRHLYSDLFVISPITFRHCCLAWSRLHENLETARYKVTYWVDFPSESANYHEDTDRKMRVICQMIQNKTKDPLMMNTLMDKGKVMLQLEIESISISDFVKLQEKNTEYNRLKIFLRLESALSLSS